MSRFLIVKKIVMFFLLHWPPPYIPQSYVIAVTVSQKSKIQDIKGNVLHHLSCMMWRKSCSLPSCWILIYERKKHKLFYLPHIGVFNNHIWTVNSPFVTENQSFHTKAFEQQLSSSVLGRPLVDQSRSSKLAAAVNISLAFS